MKRFVSTTVFFGVLATCQMLLAPLAPAETPGERTIQLTPGDPLALVNGAEIELDIPAFVKSGHTLVPLRFVGENLKTNVDWHPETRTVVLSTPSRSIELQIDHPEALIDGETLSLPVPPRIEKGRTMVPLRFVSEALNTKVHFDESTKLITITLPPPPIARFSLSQTSISPGEKAVVHDESTHPEGLEIVEHSWTGLQDTYNQAGKYEIALRVKDANGTWSDPFVRELIVNTLPIAEFHTKKKSYKIGEPVDYINDSHDQDGQRLTYKWTDQKPAFFEAGEHWVMLEAEDPMGGKSTARFQVSVSDEIHYTPTEYYLLYGPPKSVMPFAYNALSYPVIEAPIEKFERTLIKSNSPELIRTPGLLYRDTADGLIRIMVHHSNKTGSDLKIHALAENPGSEPVTVTLTRQGLAQPTTGILHQGREHLSRFFTPQSPQTIVIPPGETIDLLSSLSKHTLKPDFTVSGLFDLEVDASLVFSVVAVRPGSDPVTELAELPILPPDGQHFRGTFPTADRQIVVPATAAQPNARLVLGDITYDPPVAGIDALTGQEMNNYGNYGVVYEIVFEELKAGTAVLLNPRGGVYTGAVRMNDSVLETPLEGYLKPPNQAAVIYRATRAGSLRLQYSAPSGSNLPINFLLVELPENKEK